MRLMSTVEVLAGALATEARLLQLLADHRDEARRDPTLLATPVRVIVPSRSLRLHVGERIAAEQGAAAGVAVQTLHAASIEILDRAGCSARGGDALVEILARRIAREEADLRRAFEPFLDGYRTVAASVRDLLDAGLQVEHAEAVLEALHDAPLSGAEKDRAGAVVRTAVRVARAMAERGLGSRSELLRRAREALETDARVLPARAVVVHGFADATGRAADLLEALMRIRPTRVLLDHPPDPIQPGRPDPGVAFTQRLMERLGGVAKSARPARAEGENGEPREADRFRAPGATAEVRAVAGRIRALLDDGARPERIGIAARDLSGYRACLREQLHRLGIPCSALRTRAPLDGAGRRITALVELLETAGQTSVDRWLDAAARLAHERGGEALERAPSTRLRLGLRKVGAARLADAAAVLPEDHLQDDSLPLPIRTRVAPGDGGDAQGSARRTAAGERRFLGFHAPRARLGGWELRGAVRAAGAALERLEQWPERAPLGRHLARLAQLRRQELGWRARDPAERRVWSALENLEETLGAEELAFAELASLLRRTLTVVAAPPLGGEGGGVQVLDAMEARGRTFEHLFVVGLNRDVFPRVVREDPLLGDDARRALAALLPDVPIKGRSRDEDRYLFAQLLSASPRVTLSWQLAGDDGKPRVASPLIERLLGERSEDGVAVVPPLYPKDRDAAAAGPRTARERAVLGGLFGELQGSAGRLGAALAESAPPFDPGPVAAVRARVLAAWERGPFEPERMAPYLGYLGALEEVGARPDPRVEPPYVTRLEGQASCPWRTVLAKLLRLEDGPDPLDGLPGIDPRTVGVVVHGVLQAIAQDALGTEERDLSEVLARAPVRTPWPDSQRFEQLLWTVTEAEVRRERAPLPGLVRMLAECARAHLERARGTLADEAARFSDGGALGVEVRGTARLPDELGGHRVEFQADRVDRCGDSVVLTDFKTGKVMRSAELRKTGVATGRFLQPLAYAVAAAAELGERGPSVRGRYLYLKADAETEVADVSLGAEWEAHLGELAAALDTLVGGWVAGSFFPRLHDEKRDKEPDACRYCDVAPACSRRDSGAKRALLALARGEAGDDPGSLALRELWGLAARGAKK